MVDFTELDGVGPARSDYLEEAGYDTFEAVAEADNEVLAEDVDIPEDTALELVVQSQNIVAEQEAEVEEREPDTITDEIEEAQPDEQDSEEEPAPVSEEDSDSDAETVEEEDEDAEIVFSIAFTDSLEYDTFFDSVMAQRMTMYRTNRTGVEAFDHALDQMRDGSAEEPVEMSLEEDQLNDLHNSVRQKIIAYKGDNLIDHMDALKSVMTQIEEVRSEHLF